MKVVRRLFFLALLGGYFFWPYHATKRFSRALQENDSDTVTRMIDAEAFAESMKDLAVDAAMMQLNQRMGTRIRAKSDEVREKLRSFVNSRAFTAQFGSHFKAEAIARRMVAGESEAKSAEFTNPGWRNQRWVNPVTFSVQDPHSEARAIFKFRGLGWKLAGIEIPEKEMAHFIPAMMNQ